MACESAQPLQLAKRVVESAHVASGLHVDQAGGGGGARATLLLLRLPVRAVKAVVVVTATGVAVVAVGIVAAAVAGAGALPRLGLVVHTQRDPLRLQLQHLVRVGDQRRRLHAPAVEQALDGTQIPAR
jgi:hypothetical protein